MAEMSPGRPAAEELLRHREWVRALARTLVRDDASADDLAQDAWLAAVEHPPRRTDAPRSWFARVLRSRAIDAFRASSSRGAREDAAARRGAEPSAADTVAQAETHRRVVEAVMALDEPYRTAVLLRFFDDLPPSEVARRTGVPVETARTRVRRGVEQLRARLAPRDDDRGRAALLVLSGARRGAESGGAAAAAAGGVLVALGAKHAAIAIAAVAICVAAATAMLRDDRTAEDTAATPAAATSASSAPEGPARAARPASAETSVPEATQTTSASPRLRLRVRRDDGAPLAGAVWALFDEQSVHARGRLGPDATIDAAPSAGARRVVVVPPDCVPHVAEVAAGPGEGTLVVPAGETVSGRVDVEGGLPPRRLRVWITPERPVVPFDALPQGIDDLALAGQVPVRVGPDGVFRVGGFARGAAGIAYLPHEFEPVRSAAGSDDGTFVAPQSGLVLRGRTRLPHVEGRVVRRGTGAPLPGVTVTLRGVVEGGEWVTSMRTEDDGTFALGGGDASAASAELTVRELGGIATCVTTIAGPLDRPVAVGDLAATDPWESAARLVVTDADGRPVAGARACFGDVSAWVSAPSGEDGELAVPLAGAPRGVVVAAAGHGWAAIEATPATRAAQRVELPRGTLVEIEFAGAPPPGARVRVSGPTSALCDEPAVSGLAGALGFSDPLACTRDAAHGDFTLYDASESRGRIRVGFLRAGSPLRVEAADAAGGVLFAGDLVLVAGERRRVRIDVPPLRTWTGRVVDAAGQPVEGASVRFRASGAEAADASGRVTDTAADGTFRVAGLAALRIDAVVSATGCRPVVLRGLDVDPPATVPLVVRMERGRTIVVRVRGDADSVRAEPDRCDPAGPFGPLWEADTTGDGEWTIDGLPDGGAEVVVAGATRTVRVRAEAGGARVDVALDAPPAAESR
jgi:RNA polymerase sigma-70 factor (ECF subfamily)